MLGICFIGNKKVYPNYIYFSTSTHGLFSAKPTYLTELSFSNTFSGKLPLATQPWGSLTLFHLPLTPNFYQFTFHKIPCIFSFLFLCIQFSSFPLHYHFPKSHCILYWTLFSCFLTLFSVSPGVFPEQNGQIDLRRAFYQVIPLSKCSTATYC